MAKSNQLAKLFFERVDKVYPKFMSQLEHQDTGDLTTYTFRYEGNGAQTTVRVIETSNLDGNEAQYISPTYNYHVEYDTPKEGGGVATSYLYVGAKHFKTLNKIFSVLLRNWRTIAKSATSSVA